MTSSPDSEPSGFATATAVTTAGNGHYTAVIQPGWDILGAANGGYLLAMPTRALIQATGRQPVTVTGHYLAPGTPGPVVISTEIIKEGRTFTTAAARTLAGERALLAVQGTFGQFDTASDILLQDATAPAMPPADQIPRFRHDPASELPPPFVERLEIRIHPDDTAFAQGKPSGKARMRAWVRLLDDEPVDACALVMAADCLPPTTFNAGLPIAWTPTLELTVHIRAIPRPGWLRLDFATRFVSNGRLEVDGLIWDADDRLVAQSRQIALIPRSS